MPHRKTPCMNVTPLDHGDWLDGSFPNFADAHAEAVKAVRENAYPDIDGIAIIALTEPYEVLEVIATHRG